MTAKKTSRTQMFGALVNSIAETSKTQAGEEQKTSSQPHNQRVGSGVVAATKETVIAELRQERDRLKTQLAEKPASDVVELDPNQVDPSPFPDRLSDAASEEAILSLRQSIEERGQEIPILVRPHPDEEGRYQVAYGHRRLKAISGLAGKKVRAVVQALSDAELVQAQGIENSDRQDLSFIERVLFAAHVRALCTDPKEEVARVKLALSITDAEASYLKRVHAAVPDTLIRAIGPAPKIGRPRWMKMADHLESDRARQRAHGYITSQAFSDELSSDKRFQLLFSHLQKEEDDKADKSTQPVALVAGDVTLGSFKKGARKSELVLLDSRFAEHVAHSLASLYEDYKKKS
ncbi:plasmid partitioning protein RepB [uncultured Cohaesibacter sp.]|uniref:plasmid partitioning protein RepB n=1 Tax=uncultured Cohaesibacter sp. TaxID=1002546 RepID=UPI002AA6C86E|nr:plasmid partitioning protein RepB [uncultured Cohaesibacter sp.]